MSALGQAVGQFVQLKAARELPCQGCGKENGTVVAAHSNQLRDGKGRGMKAHDFRIAALCFDCHRELDQGSTMNKQEKICFFEEAHRKTIGLFFMRGIIGVLT
jgi:hypothetical protein